MGRCDRLKWNRKKLGMSQQDLANKIGVSVSTISKLETDETAWATIRDTTEDAVSDVFRSLGSWQCDLDSVLKDYDNKKDVNDKKDCLEMNDICNLIVKKRASLGISQKKLGTIIGIDGTTISKYESGEKLWNNRATYNNTQKLLIDFINGKYDGNFSATAEHQPEYISSVGKRKEDTTTSIIVPEKKVNDSCQSVESTLNTVIDILQEKISHDENTEIYINMIIGICNGYLQKV